MLDILHVHYDTTHNDDFVYHDESCVHDWWLLLLVHTPAFFIVNGTEYLMPGESAILYPPHSVLHYGAHGNSFFFRNDWIRFHPDDTHICNGKLPIMELFEIIDFNYLHTLVKLLFYERFYNYHNRSSSVNCLFKLIYNKLEDSYVLPMKSTQLDDLYSLRLEIKNNPGYDWRIPDMADRLFISVSYFHRLYQRTFGKTCMKDIIDMRIAHAKELLVSETTPIKTIADYCGYKNVEHFSRQFKLATGMSPSTYRLRNCT